MLPKADDGYLQHIYELNNNRGRAFPVVSGNGIIGLIQAISAVWAEIAGWNRSALASLLFSLVSHEDIVLIFSLMLATMTSLETCSRTHTYSKKKEMTFFVLQSDVNGTF